MLLNHVLQIFISRDGDQRVDIFAGNLVLETKGAVVKEGPREVGHEGGEIRERGAAINGDDASLAGGVEERFLVGAGDDLAAVAAHEAELGVG